MGARRCGESGGEDEHLKCSCDDQVSGTIERESGWIVLLQSRASREPLTAHVGVGRRVLAAGIRCELQQVREDGLVAAVLVENPNVAAGVHRQAGDGEQIRRRILVYVVEE